MAITKPTIVIITCYHDPNYVRAATLRAVMTKLPEVEIVIIKNRWRGIGRYLDVAWQLWQVKRSRTIEAYLLTFRGQEILPYILWQAGGRPVIFDEFIVPMAYASQEKHIFSFLIWFKHILARLGQPVYHRCLLRCRLILADTEAHATLSSKINGVAKNRYLVVPVGADETVFRPTLRRQTTTDFRVFYYSSGMQPLHGIPTVLAAAELLKSNPAIRFVLAGGGHPMKRAVEIAKEQGAHIEYHSWIPFENLLDTIRKAAICLGGPFGDTPQAHHVITGKTYQFLASGMPVIIGSSSTTDHYFQDKLNALLVPQANPQALADAIMWASQHPGDLQVIAANGRQLYEHQFSIAAITAQLQPTIKRLVS